MIITGCAVAQSLCYWRHIIPIGASRDFLTSSHSPRGQTPTDFHTKWLKRRGFTQGCAFWSKNRNFTYPLISRAPKRSQFGNFLDVEILRSIWPLTLEVQRQNTPYSSSEPNESGILNRQSGGKKLKYVLKFYIGGTCPVISRMRKDYSALCL